MAVAGTGAAGVGLVGTLQWGSAEKGSAGFACVLRVVQVFWGVGVEDPGVTFSVTALHCLAAPPSLGQFPLPGPIFVKHLGDAANTLLSV